METFSALLAICAGNSPVTSEFPAQRPVQSHCNGWFLYAKYWDDRRSCAKEVGNHRYLIWAQKKKPRYFAFCWFNPPTKICRQEKNDKSFSVVYPTGRSHYESSIVIRQLQTMLVVKMQSCTAHRPVAKFPQCTSPVSCNGQFLQKCARVCTFLLQKGASWSISRALWDLWCRSITFHSSTVCTYKTNSFIGTPLI